MLVEVCPCINKSVRGKRDRVYGLARSATAWMRIFSPLAQPTKATIWTTLRLLILWTVHLLYIGKKKKNLV
jgi:hypothetical protein